MRGQVSIFFSFFFLPLFLCYLLYFVPISRNNVISPKFWRSYVVTMMRVPYPCQWPNNYWLCHTGYQLLKLYRQFPKTAEKTVQGAFLHTSENAVRHAETSLVRMNVCQSPALKSKFKKVWAVAGSWISFVMWQTCVCSMEKNEKKKKRKKKKKDSC